MESRWLERWLNKSQALERRILDDGVHHEPAPTVTMDTPPKTNMEPENGPLEKEIPIGNHHFQVPC